MKQTLTADEVDSIIGAIEIAEDESGGDYSDIKTKLLTIYPKTKELRKERQKKWDSETEKQQIARKEVARMVFTGLVDDKPIIDQLKTLILIKDNYNIIRAHYSDEICLSADLFKYHLKDLIKLGLIAELKDYIKQESQVKGNEWMNWHYKNETDAQLWHILVKILDSVKRS